MDTIFPSRGRRRASGAFMLFVVIALLLQACAGAGASPTPTAPEAQAQPTDTEAAMATEEPGVTEEPAVTEEPTESTAAGGTLRIAMQPIVQTDPGFISSDPEILVANHVYDYLVDISPENTIEPRLATEWEASEDGLTYVITLAEGVTFHDGSDFTAEDVVWTYDRLRDAELGLPTASLYENIEGIEATGDLEVTFTLSEPNPFFLFDLSDNHALMMKAGSEDPSDFNGTGPFVVVDYRPEDRLVAEANPNYFIEGQPNLAGLEFIFFGDQTAQVEALRGGQVDLVLVISTDLYQSLEGQPGLELLQVATNAFDLVRLRADQEPGDDPRVIQALKLATDRDAIYNLVLQGFGETGRDSPIGPLYQEYYTEETPLPGRDVEEARRLLAEAGYEDSLNLELHTPDTGNRPNLAVVLKEQWAEAGVNVEVLVEPESVYYGEDGWLEVNLGITGWGSRPYPQFYLDVMLACDAIWNEAHFCDEELDELIATTGTTMDEQERTEAYHEIQRILIERGPIIIPYFFSQLGAINDQFQGFEMKAFPGRSDLRPVTSSGS